MASYNSVLRHVSMADIKRNTWKLQEQKRVEELCRKEELEKIAKKNSPKYSDWRFDLSENMTTQAMTYATTLPAEGDTTLADVTSTEYTLGSGATVNGSTVVLDSNNLPGLFGNAEIKTGFIDINNYTTLKINVTKRTVGSSEELRLFYRTTPGGSFFLIRNELFNDQTLDLTSLRDFGEVEFQIRSFYAGGDTPRDYTTWNINSFVFQRRTPITVFVALDSPEATAFVRTGEFSELSNEEKIKKLKQMMNASDEYLTNKFGDAFPGTNASQEFEDVQSAPSWEEAAGEESEISTPSKSSIPNLYQNRSAAWIGGSIQAAATTIENGEGFLKDQFRGTDVSVPTLISLGKELARLNKTIGSGRGSVEQLQRLIDLRNNTQERIKAEIEGGKPDLKPVTQVPSSSDNRAELEKNIEASLKQLEIDNEELKGEGLKRNLGFAIDLGLDILTVVTLLSPIPGDEVAAISAQAAKSGVKTGAKTFAQQQTIDAFHRTVGSPQTLAAAQQAINRAGSKFSKDVAIPITVQGKTINVNASRILRNKGFKVDSYQPQGEMIVEKKLKNPQAFFKDKDIKPEFPENPPPPQIKGLHPDLVTGEKTAQRFNKLDPISARAMPRTGIKSIDKKVQIAKKKPK